ncbi:MAG: hypothetical protein ABIN11_05985 [candidate division WOR-3 bacterium]
MFSKLIQSILVLTSIAPVLLTFWFKNFSKDWKPFSGFIYLFFSFLLIILLVIIIKIAKSKLEVKEISINEISNADNESVIFIFTYLIPLLNIDEPLVLFLLGLTFVIVSTTNIYHFNPFLGLLGYHQYKMKLQEGMSFILITKKTLYNTKQIKKVVQLTNYILLEREEL